MPSKTGKQDVLKLPQLMRTLFCRLTEIISVSLAVLHVLFILMCRRRLHVGEGARGIEEGQFSKHRVKTRLFIRPVDL